MVEMHRSCTDKDTGQATDGGIGRCPLCGDMIRIGWGKCHRCGEPLEGSSRAASGFARPSLPLNRKGLLHLAGGPRLRSGAVRQCSLCGDMVNIEWEKCPRCEEPIGNPELP